jgi:hypothetical protein
MDEDEFSEESYEDIRMQHFFDMSDEEKENLKCDELFCLYLRHMSKQVNATFYKTVLRFVLLYRTCMNECAFYRRRDHFKRADMINQDETLNKLLGIEPPQPEEEEEEAKKELKMYNSTDEREVPVKTESQRENSFEEGKVMELEAALVEEHKETQEDKDEEKEKSEEQEEEEDDFRPPEGVDYSAEFNGDFLPIICNDFVTDFLDKPHGICMLDRSDAIDLTRNFCHWISVNQLTCARISLN